MEWLHGACQDARVLAVVTRATYVEDRQGQIFWISSPHAPLHRRSIQVPSPGTSWPEGTSLHVGDGVLTPSVGCPVDATTAAVWRAPFPPAPSVPWDAVACVARSGFDLCARARMPRGVATLFDRCASTKPEVLQAASETSRAVIRAVLGVVAAGPRSTVELLAALDPLVGLGEGLTPSGDDFLGGFLFALRHKDSSADIPMYDWCLVDKWVRHVGPRTTEVSACVSRDLARGHGPEPLHEMLVSIFSGAPAERAARHAFRLVEIGRTTGWDILAGAVAALCGVAGPGLEGGTSRCHGVCLSGVSAGMTSKGLRQTSLGNDIAVETDCDLDELEIAATGERCRLSHDGGQSAAARDLHAHDDDARRS